MRSGLAGLIPTVIIKAGASVTVRGWDSEQAAAEANEVWGLKMERKKIRFRIRDLTSARIRVMDRNGYWEARIGSGENIVSLKCGGDVTLVTDQNVEPLPPRYILGHIERPAAV